MQPARLRSLLALLPIGIRLGLPAAMYIDHVNDTPLWGDDHRFILVLAWRGPPVLSIVVDYFHLRESLRTKIRAGAHAASRRGRAHAV